VKRSPFRHHRGLAALDLFLDTMLDRRIWKTSPIDGKECLGNIYGNGSQTCHPKDKTYRYAQLGEFVHSIAVEHALKHEVICGKVKLLLNNNHLEPQAVRPQRHCGDDDLE
jgi:hypothetical protein